MGKEVLLSDVFQAVWLNFYPLWPVISPEKSGTVFPTKKKKNRKKKKTTQSCSFAAAGDVSFYVLYLLKRKMGQNTTFVIDDLPHTELES